MTEEALAGLSPALRETLEVVERLGSARVIARDVAPELNISTRRAGDRLKTLHRRGLLRITGRRRGRQGRPDNEYSVHPRLRDDYVPDPPPRRFDPPEREAARNGRFKRGASVKGTGGKRRITANREKNDLLAEAQRQGFTVESDRGAIKLRNAEGRIVYHSHASPSQKNKAHKDRKRLREAGVQGI